MFPTCGLRTANETISSRFFPFHFGDLGWKRSIQQKQKKLTSAVNEWKTKKNEKKMFSNRKRSIKKFWNLCADECRVLGRRLLDDWVGKSKSLLRVKHGDVQSLSVIVITLMSFTTSRRSSTYCKRIYKTQLSPLPRPSIHWSLSNANVSNSPTIERTTKPEIVSQSDQSTVAIWSEV